MGGHSEWLAGSGWADEPKARGPELGAGACAVATRRSLVDGVGWGEGSVGGGPTVDSWLSFCASGIHLIDDAHRKQDDLEETEETRRDGRIACIALH